MPYAKNARQHSDAQIAQIAGSIKAFKFRSPIVVTSDGGIVCGHGRVLAARKLGMEEVPCVYADDLSENERRAYILADNKIAENATWDQEMLNIELDDLFAQGFDLQIAGFTQEEILHEQGELTKGKEVEGSKELNESDFNEFDKKCPRCGFEFDEKD